MKFKDILLLLILGVLIGSGFGFLLAEGIKFPTGYFFKESVEIEELKSNEIVPVVNRDYFPTALKLIKNGKESITLVIFEARFYENYPNSKTNQLLKVLKEKAKKGVEVKVTLEGGSEFFSEEFSEKQRKVCEFLNNGGVKVRFDPKQNTTHAKLLIVDSWVLLGSTNWSHYAFEKNFESNVLMKGEKIAEFYRNFFEKIWRVSGKTGSCKVYEVSTLCNSIKNILNNRKDCDGKYVEVKGKVMDLDFKTSKQGNDYTTFELEDNGKVNVYIQDHPEVEEGKCFKVKGKYYKEKHVGMYTFYNEITASSLENC